MCPGTIAALSIASAGASAAGGLIGGISAGNSAAYQATVARQNAIISSQNASRAAMATSANTEAAGLRARQQDSLVKAGEAASGLDVGSGSPADVETSQRETGALNVANTAQRGALETYGYETAASGNAAQANLDQSQVIPDYLGGALKATGSLLSAAPNLPSSLSWMGGDDPEHLNGETNIDWLDG
jgi:hypothetical protein